MLYKGGFPPIIYCSEKNTINKTVTKERLTPSKNNTIDIYTILKTIDKPIINITVENDEIDII